MVKAKISKEAFEELVVKWTWEGMSFNEAVKIITSKCEVK